VFKDDATSFRYAYFLKHKNEVLEKFKKLDRIIKNKFGRNIRVLRSDNGLEYKNRAFDEYTDKKGIEREYTAPYTPEQNGKAERDNRTLVESARTMLLAKELPKNLWAEACSTAVYLANRAGASSTRVGATPYELWMGVKPDLHHLKIFGSEAYVNVPKIKRTKLDARAKKMIFVGYDSNSSNYRVFDPVSKKVSVSRDVTFRETTGSVKMSEPKDARKVILPKVEREAQFRRKATTRTRKKRTTKSSRMLWTTSSVMKVDNRSTSQRESFETEVRSRDRRGTMPTRWNAIFRLRTTKLSSPRMQ
jgi:hypothetical protein